MLRWYPNALLQLVLELTFVPVAIFSIFAANAVADGRTEWLIGPLSGPGATPDLGVVLSFIAIGWLLLFLGWRGAKTLFKVLIGLWHACLTIAAFLLVFNSDGYLFEGEAIGFSISLQLLGPVFTLATLSFALIWIWKDLRYGNVVRSVSPFRRRNKISLLVGATGLASTLIFFWLDYEQAGTIIGILAMFAFREGIRPVNPSRELQKALTAEGSAPK